MNKIDKDKLKKVNGGLDYSPIKDHDINPGGPQDATCKKSFDSFACNGCFNCTITHDPLNTSIKTFTCHEGYFGTIKFDLFKNKIID